jgi:hypothetical protein
MEERGIKSIQIKQERGCLKSEKTKRKVRKEKTQRIQSVGFQSYPFCVLCENLAFLAVVKITFETASSLLIIKKIKMLSSLQPLSA